MNSNKENAQENVSPNEETCSQDVVTEDVTVETPEAAAEVATQTELEEAKQALAEKDKQYQYLAAEYDNFRRRSAKEKTEAYSKAKAEAALSFLPVFDNLQRALATPCGDEVYVKGVEMTMNQLKQVLEKLDIHEIEALGQPFDPNKHNAVMHVEDAAVGENTVIEVFQSGFTMGEKVIRFAMVKVAN